MRYGRKERYIEDLIGKSEDRPDSDEKLQNCIY
jgi:hypothetical protein